MTNRTPKAVLFDLDGTLVDAIPDLVCGVNALLAKLGRPSLTESQVRTMVGKGASVLLKRAFTAAGVPETVDVEAELRWYIAWMVEHGDRHTRVFSGIPESLAKLRKAGVRTAIVTNKPRHMTQSALEHTGLAVSVDCVVAAGDAPTVKPEPEMLFLAAERLGVNPSDCVMVGDSGNDALAGRAAGMPAYLVRTGYNEGEPIDRWAAEHGFENLYDDVNGVVEALLKQP